MQKYSEALAYMRPIVQGWIQDAIGKARLSGGGGGGSGTAAHAINGPLHYGEIDPSQATWALTDAELAAHTADANAHHDQQHAFTGPDHTASGLTVGQVLRATGASSFDWSLLNHADLQNITPDQHHARQHGITSAADHTVTGAALDVIGLSGADTLGVLTPSFNPGAAAAILRSSSAGELILPIFTATTRVRSPLLDAAAAMAISPTTGLTLSPGASIDLDPASGLTRLQPDGFLQSTDYASQATGVRVSGAGEGDFRYIFADELHVKSFIADLEQALAGGQIIAKSVAELAEDFVTPGSGGGGYGTITQVGSATTATGTTGVTLARPTGAGSGHVLVAALVTFNGLTPSPPSGWTALAVASAGSYSRMWVYYRVAGGSEPANYTWSFSGGSDQIAATMTAWANVDTTTPIDVSGFSSDTTNDTSAVIGGVTTVTPGAILLAFAGFNNDTAGGTFSGTPAAGMTEFADIATANWTWLHGAYQTIGTAGATGTRTVTTSTGAPEVVGYAVALRPVSLPSSTGDLTVRDLPTMPGAAVFESGDIVLIRTGSRSGGALTWSNCWGTVTGYTDNADGSQTWTFTRSSAPNAGTMGEGVTVPARDGVLVLDFGNPAVGGGYYEVNAVDGAYGANSPYFQTVRWSGHPATGSSVGLRGGHLRGLFGVQNEYGLFAGDGIDETAGDRFLRISSNQIGLWNIPLRMYNGATETVHFGAWDDIWIGPSTADRRLDWDGALLTVRGAIVITGSSSGIGSFTDAGALATANSVDWSSQVGGTGKPADNATVGAAWGSNVTGRPAELTDGRITSAIQAGGTLISRIDPGQTWGANPGAGVAGLLLGSDYMGYWTGSAWRSYMDNLGRFYLNAGAGSNYLSWDGSTLTINGAINVTGGNAATQTYATSAASGAQTAANSYTDGVAAGKANTSLNNSAISTLITGSSIRVGSGTKDSNLNGWNIDAGEIVGQYAGADRVVLNTNGHIIAGAAGMTQRGLEVLRSGGSLTRALQFVTAIGGGERAASIDVYTDTNPILPYYNQNTLWIETFATTGKAFHSIRMVSQTIELAAGVYASSLDAGSIGTGWTALPFGTDWVDYGGGHASCAYRRFGDLVIVKGLARLPSGTNANIGNLPAGYRPATSNQVIQLCATSSGYQRVDITSAGAIDLVGGAISGMWVAINFVFSTSS